jgi:hypothetical protein
MTRGVQTDDTTSRTRSISIQNPLPPDVDKDIFERSGPWSVNAPNLSRCLGSSSHVLIAACGASEKAIDQVEGGAFTQAFLQTIQGIGHKHLTYAECIERLPPLSEYAFILSFSGPVLMIAFEDNAQDVRETREIAFSSILIRPLETVTPIRYILKRVLS